MLKDENWDQFYSHVENDVIKRNGCQHYTERGKVVLKQHWQTVKDALDSTSDSEHQFSLGFDRRTLRHWNDPRIMELGYCFNDINNDVCLFCFFMKFLLFFMKFSVFCLKFSFFLLVVSTQPSWARNKVENHKLMINVQDAWGPWYQEWCDFFEEQGWPQPAKALALELRSRFEESLEKLKMKQQRQQPESGNNLNKPHPDMYINGFVRLYIRKDQMRMAVVKNPWFSWVKPNVCFDDFLICFAQILVVFIEIFIIFVCVLYSLLTETSF